MLGDRPREAQVLPQVLRRDGVRLRDSAAVDDSQNPIGQDLSAHSNQLKLTGEFGMKKYYVARLKRTWPDPLTCLAELGIDSNEAQMLVADAQINQSEQIFVPLNDGKAILLRFADGAWQEWWAIVGELFDTPEEANEFLAAVRERTVANGMEPGTWQIAKFTPNDTMRHRQ